MDRSAVAAVLLPGASSRDIACPHFSGARPSAFCVRPSLAAFPSYFPHSLLACQVPGARRASSIWGLSVPSLLLLPRTTVIAPCADTRQLLSPSLLLVLFLASGPRAPMLSRVLPISTPTTPSRITYGTDKCIVGRSCACMVVDTSSALGIHSSCLFLVYTILDPLFSPSSAPVFSPPSPSAPSSPSMSSRLHSRSPPTRPVWGTSRTRFRATMHFRLRTMLSVLLLYSYYLHLFDFWRAPDACCCICYSCTYHLLSLTTYCICLPPSFKHLASLCFFTPSLPIGYPSPMLQPGPRFGLFPLYCTPLVRRQWQCTRCI
ncbi:hypothetical protein BD311DRAFT_746861 [Dichomitus squalens]|uniref:Uncharacterized protein n=1 Tax=Dichomitus squalens TaxID=114155 RepID=A0A4Q9N0K4_9APHY|nr:hypothetical protein BD311DRAFT_746861 [Dichomitus squalens]